MSNDSTGKTILVATLLCVVCSILVSTSAVSLKDRQVVNAKLDLQKNLLLISGVLDGSSTTPADIAEGMKRVQSKMVDFSSGEVKEGDVDAYDQEKASKDPELNHSIDSALDIAKIKRRAKVGKIYKIMSEAGELEQIVLPVKGVGLWSVLYGFLSLSPDTKTITGLGFYQHGETPGLGGEIENPKWQALWKGKLVYDDSFKPQIDVVKGQADPNGSEFHRQVDGLSGATITAEAVEKLVNYWVSDDAYGKYLATLRSSKMESSEETTESADEAGGE